MGAITETALQARLIEQLGEQGVASEPFGTLASQLVWRIGLSGDDGPVTVRLGFAGSAALFADLPRLKNATDAEVEGAALEGTLRVEWVGARPR